MKRTILFLVIGGILATITLCVAAVSPAPATDSSEIDQLKKEIKTLRQRVESLEQRLKDGDIVVVPRGHVSPPAVVDPNSLLWPRPNQRDWKRFEFNGRPYYIIPIEGGSGAGP